MIVTVEQYLPSHELICKSDTGRKITVDPFVGEAIKTSDANYKLIGQALVGHKFDMRDYWNGQNGEYICHKFEKL